MQTFFILRAIKFCTHKVTQKLSTSPREPLAFFFTKLHFNKKQNTEKRSLLDHLLPGQAVVLCKSCFSPTFCTV